MFIYDYLIVFWYLGSVFVYFLIIYLIKVRFLKINTGVEIEFDKRLFCVSFVF